MARFNVRFGDAVGEVIEAHHYTVGGTGHDEWTVFYADDGLEVGRFRSDLIISIVDESASGGPVNG